MDCGIDFCSKSLFIIIKKPQQALSSWLWLYALLKGHNVFWERNLDFFFSFLYVSFNAKISNLIYGCIWFLNKNAEKDQKRDENGFWVEEMRDRWIKIKSAWAFLNHELIRIIFFRPTIIRKDGFVNLTFG